MSIDSEISALVASQHLGTLATIKRDGRPQLSNVSYTYAESTGLVRMSLTGGRAKVKNLRRDPRASMLVPTQGGWTYGVVEGDATLTESAAEPDDAVNDELVDIYRSVAGKEHPDWEEFRLAMIAERRLVGRIQVTHTYGLPSR